MVALLSNLLNLRNVSVGGLSDNNALTRLPSESRICNRFPFRHWNVDILPLKLWMLEICPEMILSLRECHPLFIIATAINIFYQPKISWSYGGGQEFGKPWFNINTCLINSTT